MYVIKQGESMNKVSLFSTLFYFFPLTSCTRSKLLYLLILSVSRDILLITTPLLFKYQYSHSSNKKLRFFILMACLQTHELLRNKDIFYHVKHNDPDTWNLYHFDFGLLIRAATFATVLTSSTVTLLRWLNSSSIFIE